jgi:hypothetical protein
VKTFYKRWLAACAFGVASMMSVTVGAAIRNRTTAVGRWSVSGNGGN